MGLNALSVSIEGGVTGLLQFIGLRGPFVSTVRKLQQLLNTVGCRQTAELLKYLKKLAGYAKALQLEAQLRLDLSVPVNRTYYRGLVFQAVLERNNQVVAVGGRYDHLLAALRPSRARAPSGCVGFSLAADKLVTAVATERLELSRATGFTPAAPLLSVAGG